MAAAPQPKLQRAGYACFGLVFAFARLAVIAGIWRLVHAGCF